MSRASSTEMREFGSILDAMHPPLPEPYASNGWVYRDVYAWFNREEWIEMLDLFGEIKTDFLPLAFTDGPKGRRGQFFLSPDAVARSRDFLSRHEKTS